MAQTPEQPPVPAPQPGPSVAPPHPPPVGPPPPGAPPYEYPGGFPLNNLEPAALLKLLRSLPGVFSQVEPGVLKQDAAQTLSNLAQNPFPQQGLPYPPPPGAIPNMGDPGPSTHPRGPPPMNSLPGVPMPGAPPLQGPPVDGSAKPPSQNGQQPMGDLNQNGPDSANSSTSGQPQSGRRGRNPAIGTDEWTRQRKDNHKEVERRRRGNINDGINELGRIVPNGTGEKAKGAILARAVQYIHHLKENEARNIEKWTLEKLLMDQAMGDLQSQLDDYKRHWDEEHKLRIKLEAELNELKATRASEAAAAAASAQKRRSDGEPETEETAEGEREGKRQRVE